MVEVMRSSENDQPRVTAADKILDRGLGKAPAYIDVKALKHTEIIYRSADEIRKELVARGVPQLLIETAATDLSSGGPADLSSGEPQKYERAPALE
jgi:hypothetical protein